jgi:hypothetical protein
MLIISMHTPLLAARCQVLASPGGLCPPPRLTRPAAVLLPACLQELPQDEGVQVDVALQRAVCAVLLGSPAVALQVLGLAEGCKPPSEGTLAQAVAYVQVGGWAGREHGGIRSAVWCGAGPYGCGAIWVRGHGCVAVLCLPLQRLRSLHVHMHAARIRCQRLAASAA